MRSLTFNGIKKPWIYLLRGRQKAPFAPINRGSVTIPGRDGAVPTTTNLEPMVITQPVGFTVKNDAEALLLKDELASWLYTQKPAPLVFPDEPNRTYYAVVQNTLDDFEKMAMVLRQGTIQFLCFDPLAYGEKRTTELNRVTSVANEGTAGAIPEFDLTVTKDTSLIYITNYDNLTPAGDGRSIVIGQPKEVDIPTKQRKTLIMHDTMQSTANWVGATSVDNGNIVGTMSTDSEGFYVSDWGQADADLENSFDAIDKDIDNRRSPLISDMKKNKTELRRLREKKNPTDADKQRIKELEADNQLIHSELVALEEERQQRKNDAKISEAVWIGPSLKRSLPKPLNSFVADIRISNRNETDLNGARIDSGVGIIEVYMRDANDNVVCKIGFGDSSDNSAENLGSFMTVGERYPAKKQGWNNFDGVLRIVRESDYFYPYIARIENGKHINVWEYPTYIIPGPGVGTNLVTSIQVAMRKWIGSKRIYQRIKEVKVWDAIGEWDYEAETPIEFKIGDHIYVNASTGDLLLNGEERSDLISPETDTFQLIEGINTIEISEEVSGTETHRNRYL